MPKIPIYENDVQAQGQVNSERLNAQDIAPTSGIENFGTGLMEAGTFLQKHANREDTSKIAADGASGHAQLLQLAQDESDKGIFDQDRFMEVARKHFDLVTEGATTSAGKNYAVKESARYLENLQEVSHKLTAKADGEAYTNNHRTVLNATSTATLNNPGNFNRDIDAYHSYIKEQVDHGANKDLMMKLQADGEKQIAESNAMGHINANPETGRALLQNGYYKDMLDGTQTERLLHLADTTENINRVKAERADKEQKDAVKKQQMDIENNFIDRAITGKVNLDELTRGDGSKLEPSQKRELVNFVRKMNTEKFKGDPAIEEEVRNRIHLPDGDPNKIINESDLFGVDGLGGAGLSRMRKEIQKRRTDDGSMLESDMVNSAFNAVKKSLVGGNPMAGIKDPQGEENFLKFKIWGSQYINDERKKGTPLADLTTPGNPKYIGNFKSSFARTQTQILKDMTNNYHGTPQPLPNAGAPTAQGGTPPPPSSSPQTTQGAANGRNPPLVTPKYKQGDISSNGKYKFKGGDSTKRENWEPIK